MSPGGTSSVVGASTPGDEAQFLGAMYGANVFGGGAMIDRPGSAASSVPTAGQQVHSGVGEGSTGASPLLQSAQAMPGMQMNVGGQGNTANKKANKVILSAADAYADGNVVLCEPVAVAAGAQHAKANAIKDANVQMQKEAHKKQKD